MTPRDAATVVLLRAAGARLETLMLRRRATLSFAAGDWVFPGGVIDASDASPAWNAQLPEPAIADDAERALRIAACRETFEESGVLLARHRSGGACDPALLYALQRERHAVANSTDAFRTLLARHDLVLDPAGLACWANWVTPAYSPKRFDTRFYIATMPAAQQIDVHEGESQDSRWVEIDAEHGAAGLDPPVTAPPTLYTLREIARQHARVGSLEALLDWARAQQPVALMLKVRRDGNAMLGLLPWDSEYESVAGEGMACSDAQRARFAEYPSRIRVEPPVRPAR